MTIGYRVVAGFPDCGPHQPLPVYEYQNSSDRLFLRPEGILRHYTHYKPMDDDMGYGHMMLPAASSSYYDHTPGSYCLDKVSLTIIYLKHVEINEKFVNASCLC